VLRTLAIICIASTALIGQAKTTSPAKKAPTPAGTSAQEDKQIEAAIHAKLAKSKIGKDGFKVRVQGGIAYWEGSTDVLQHKGSATRMAKTAGAKSVVNNIKISDAGKEKATDNLDQGRRRAQLKRSDPRTEKGPDK
jgi:osmotically-inducible protein OsmY